MSNIQNEEVNNMKKKPQYVDVEFIEQSQPINGDISESIRKIYNLSKTIKIITYLSAIFSFTLCAFNIYFLIPILVTVIGWYGAHQYNKTLSIIYVIYLFLVTLLRGYIFMTVFLNYEPSKKGDLYFEMIIVSLSSIVNLLLMIQVTKFINLIEELNYITRERLYRGQIIV